MNSATEQLIRARAGNSCEYCRLPQSAHEERFSIDHVIPKKHGGSDNNANLALSCLHCNLFKGPNLSGIDPNTNSIVTLFNPRPQIWNEHFESRAEYLTGRTPIGRATIAVMAMNSPERLLLRKALIAAGLMAPRPE